jgi:hypothetical protein
MGTSLEELSPHLKRTAQAQRLQNVHQLRERQVVGQKISELLADPRWEIYGRHVEAVRDSYQRRLDAVGADLLTQFYSETEYMKKRCEYAQAKEAVKALDTALTIAKTLIEQGEAAAAEINKVDKVG